MNKQVSVKKNAMLNMIKQACSVVFPLITFPYVSRVLGAESFGKVNFANSIIQYFALFAGLGISTYAVREGARVRDDKEKIEKLVNELFSINVCTATASLGVLVLLVIFWPKLHSYVPLMFIEAQIIVLTTCGSDWINSIYEDFQYITIRYIVLQSAAIIPLFLFVRTPHDYIIYALIIVLAGYGGNLFNIYYIRRYVNRKFTLHCNWKKHITPILVLFSTAVAVKIYLNSDITMLGILSTEKQTGIYSATSRIYQMVKELINAITIVMVPRISNMLQNREEEQYEHLSNSTLNILVSLIMPLTVGLIVLRTPILYIVCGKEYLSGSNTLMILSLALPLGVLSCFYCNAILIPNREEKFYLVSTSIAAIVNIALNMAFIPLFGISGAAITTLIAELIVFLMSRVRCRKLLKINFKKKNLLSVFVGCIVELVYCMLIIRGASNNYIIQTILCVLGSIPLYFMVLKVFHNESLQELMSVRKK